MRNVAIVLFLILVVFKHEHSWSQATCQNMSYCYDCGESLYGYGPHAYQYGKCSVCGKISDEAMRDITDTVKSIYAFYWILNFNEYIEIGHADDRKVDFSETTINSNTCIVKGNIITKAKNDKYYTDDFTLHLINQEGDWVRDSAYELQFNVQPIECYQYGTIAEYYYTQSPTYVCNFYSGQSKSTLSFTDETCTVKIYDYYGLLESVATFDYYILHGVVLDSVILDGVSEDIELYRQDDALFWGELVFLLQ